jgi:hypothetical protein
MANSQQSVIVVAKMEGIRCADLFEELELLEHELESAIAYARAGEFVRNQVGAGEFALVMQGPDADKLFCAVSGILRRSCLVRDGAVVMRYGPPGAPQQKVGLPVH